MKTPKTSKKPDSKGLTPNKAKRRPGAWNPSPAKKFNINKPYGKS